jgi:hypothetical protein
VVCLEHRAIETGAMFAQNGLTNGSARGAIKRMFKEEIF